MSTKWKNFGNNAITPKRSKEEQFAIRRKMFKDTMAIDRMQVVKPKNNNLPKRTRVLDDEDK